MSKQKTRESRQTRKEIMTDIVPEFARQNLLKSGISEIEVIRCEQIVDRQRCICGWPSVKGSKKEKESERENTFDNAVRAVEES